MRNAFAAEVTALAAADDRIVLLSGDIGNRLFDNYKSECSGRFYNCGVAEANMTSMAAGMALCGLRPITYTIAPFNTIRCLEQIKLDICYHNLPVIIVGVGAGLSYANLGATHHACEDIALLRVLPNISLICPGDAVEVRLAIRAAIGHNGPTYIRLGKKNEPTVHRQEPPFQIGKGITVREGSNACLLSTGNMLPVAVDAAEVLAARGVSARVVSFHTVKPLDEVLLQEAFVEFPIVAAIEEHSCIGGFSSSIAEWLADRPAMKGKLVRIATEDRFLHSPGNRQNSHKTLGLTPEGIAERIIHFAMAPGPLSVFGSDPATPFLAPISHHGKS